MHSRRAELSRRGLLGLSAGALLSGCLPGKHRADRPLPPDPDLVATASVRTDELALVAAYDAAIDTFPALAPTLAPMRQHHQEHLAALPRDARSGSPRAVQQATTTSEQAAVLRSLVAGERAAAATRIADCLSASVRLAPLLASIGASEAAHASVLAGVGRPR